MRRINLNGLTEEELLSLAARIDRLLRKTARARQNSPRRYTSAERSSHYFAVCELMEIRPEISKRKACERFGVPRATFARWHSQTIRPSA